MDRNTTNRQSGPAFGPKLALLAGAAIASVALSGCTTASAPRADVSYNKAQVALEKGQTTKAIAHAESAVLADPRNAEYRALLGAAYLEAGRFDSAATSFGDALELGDAQPRTVLSYALAMTAMGKGKQANEELLEWESALDPADAGLALALAGNPERGVFVLTNAIRAGHNSAKLRQNLAYTYALAGNWRAARVMAAEDVPADKLDARLSSWAATARDEDYQLRVANLLNVSPVSDGGMPVMLALSNFPSQNEMVAEAEASVPGDAAPAQVAAAPSEAEKLAFALGAEKDLEKVDVASYAKPEAAPSPAPVAKTEPAKPAGPVFVSKPVVQKIAGAPTKVKSSQRRMAVASSAGPVKAVKGGSHLIQLGSFDSEAVAKSKWGEFQKKFPQLKGHDVVITKAEVKGKTFYRVAAAGFGRSSALDMCKTVKSAGRGCFAYSAKNPPKGAVNKGVRIAARTR